MLMILARFWPVLVPVVLYLIWHEIRNRKAVKAGDERRPLHDGPWRWMVSATVALAFGLVLWFGLTEEPRTHTGYQPAKIHDGKLLPGQFVPQNNE